MDVDTYDRTSKMLQSIHIETLRLRRLIKDPGDAGYAGLSGLSDIGKHTDETRAGMLYTNYSQLLSSFHELENDIKELKSKCNN